MKNKDIMNAVANALNEEQDAQNYGMELLDADLDAISGGAAESCNSFKCGTYSAPSQPQKPTA